jgi:hypothetical protein
VCSFESGISSEDLDSFAQFIDLFKGAQEKISLLITRSEGRDEESKMKLIENIMKHPKLTKLVNLIKGKIFFAGAIRTEDVRMGRFESVISQLWNLTKMRKMLYEQIFESFDYCHIRDLNYYKENQMKVEILQNKLTKMVEDIEQKDNKLEHYEEKQQELEKTTEELKKLKGFVMKERALSYKDVLIKVDGYKKSYKDILTKNEKAFKGDKKQT